MAKYNPKSPTGGRYKCGTPKTPAQVRTGGFQGSDSMQKLQDFSDSGAGVDESKVKFVGDEQDPNEGIRLIADMPGAED